MTADGDGAEESEPAPSADRQREHMLSMLNEAAEHAHHKATDGRVRNPETEKVRVQYMRVLGYLTGQHRQLTKDLDLEDMQAEIEELRAAQEQLQATGADGSGNPYQVR